MKDYDQKIEALVDSLGIPTKDRDLMIASIYQNLKIRIGFRLASTLSEEEMDKLEPIMKDDSDKTSISKLEQVLPEFDKILDEEINAFKKELA